MDHVGEMALCDFNGKRLDLAGPQGRDPAADRRQGEAANAVEQASHRRRKLRIAHFRASTKIRSLRCSSSPRATRSAGLARGPRHETAHFAAACTMVRVVLTAAWAV